MAGLTLFLCLSLFGVYTEVWLRYIRFELDHGDASKVANLHYRAKLTLEPVLAEQFLTQYTLLQLQG